MDGTFVFEKQVNEMLYQLSVSSCPARLLARPEEEEKYKT